MSAPTTPYSDLATLYRFHRYQSQAEYERLTGWKPLWNPARPPKYWEDRAAGDSPKRVVVYEVLAMQGINALAGPDGHPFTEPMALSRDEASTVNIPPLGANVTGAEVPEVPVPLSNLPPNTRLVFRFGGTVAVRNLLVPLPDEGQGFGTQDREMLALVYRWVVSQGGK